MKSIIKMSLLIFLVSAGLLQGTPGNWEVMGKMPVKLYGAEAVVVDSTIYVLGGYSDSLQAVVDWIMAFNPKNNQWHLAGHMVKKRVNFVAGVVGKKIYYFGGEYYNTFKANGLLEVFDCDSLVTAVADSNKKFNRISASGIFDSSSIYVVGGRVYNPPQGQNSYIFEYSIPTKTVIFSYGGMPGIQEEQSTVFYKNYIYILGGIYNTVSDDIRIYKLQNHQLTEIHPGLTTLRASARALLLPDTNLIVIMGGFNEGSRALNSVEQYSINDSIHVSGSILSPLNKKRKNFMSVYFNHSIYVFGGQNEFDNSVMEIERFDFINAVDESENQIPSGFSVAQNYPNPFNPATTIRYNVPETSLISLKVYDLLGNVVDELVNETKHPGNYSVIFPGNNLTSGVYFYRLSATGYNGMVFSETKKMILLK